ncbi:MAG: FAD-dependent oxidoreductase [Proteobacteria bacterium]|nr:FAD-dependent oxidoreductase [Pseudomonadota bacterium]
MNPGKRRATVIGAGIIGVCSASYLQREGFEVEIVDPEPPGTMCSHGNAGGICPGSCIPIAGPGMLKKVPGWLTDPEGPLHIRLSYLPRLLPWLVRFLRAGRVEEVRRISAHMRALHRMTFDYYEPLLRDAGCPDLLEKRGQLFVYESANGPDGDSFSLGLRREAGVAVEVLSQSELRQLEPSLAPFFQSAVFLPEQGQCKNPGRLVATLAEAVQRNGGTVRRTRVHGVRTEGGKAVALATDQGEVPVDRLVVAAGAWSGTLARKLGSPVPLETERGYHAMVMGSFTGLRVQTMWAERKFVAAPMEEGIRFAGTVEFAGLAAPPDMRRADVLLRLGRRMLPALGQDEPIVRWMGHRPSLPDSLPVIGPSPRFGNVWFAFGHGHTGLIGGSVTGRLVADLIAGTSCVVDPAPYRIDRF